MRPLVRAAGPENFSYNSSQGWCPKCRGFGELFYLPDVDRGARADAIEESWYEWQEGEREICPDCHGARLNPRRPRGALGKVPAPRRNCSDIRSNAYDCRYFSNASVDQTPTSFQK